MILVFTSELVCWFVFLFFCGHFNQLGWLNVDTFHWGCICRATSKSKQRKENLSSSLRPLKNVKFLESFTL